MMKLKRNADGSYSGNYKGNDFTVRKEKVHEHITPTYVKTSIVWIARSGTFAHRSNSTRDEAVQGLLNEFDRAAVNVPEVDALLKRWAEEIKAIVPLLNERDISACSQLQLLKSNLAMLDGMVRAQAVLFEESLARLRASVQSEPAQATPALSDRVAEQK
jgi:hypothetical protein